MTDMKKYLNYTLTALALVVLVACADEASSTSSGTTPTPEGGKTLIAFSQEGSAMTTRGFTRAGFDSNTKVVMRIKAEGKTASDVRYTQAVATAAAQTTADDGCNTGYGLVGTHSHLNYAAGMNRYWDDAFGRDTKLTVYAVAVPNLNDDDVLPSTILDQTSPTPVAPDWYTTTENTKISWSVNTVQTATTRSKEDLAYSNNIRSAETVNKGCYRQTWDGSAWAKSMQLGRMIWQSKDPSDASVTVGQFDKGHLAFKHALSWLTIVLKEGSGFKNSSDTDFKWTNNNATPDQNITLKGFPTSGKLDLSNGEWYETTSSDITKMHESSVTTTSGTSGKTERTLEAYVLPGTVLDDNASNFIEFEIDNAKYYVSGEQIAEAVKTYYSATPTSPYASFTTTEAGKHYVINLTVSKKGIENITAAILDWETVNSSDATPDNVYCSFNFEDRGDKLGLTNAAKFNIYRAGLTTTDYITGETTANYDWKTGYATDGAATKTWYEDTSTANDDHWTTNWFWPNNLTYYHFRAAGYTDNTSGTPSITINTDATNGDYFTITSGTIDGGTYKDYVWGAPFKDIDASAKLTYDHTGSTPYGFDGNSSHQISQAIGATNSQINMLLFHMTSQITVKVSSVTGDGSVKLIDGDNKTKVEILNFLPDGKVLMGTGAVSATDGTRVTEGVSEMAYQSVSTDGTVSYTYGIVPQPLSYTTGKIGLCITTPDGNKYYVRDLSTCTATVSNYNLVIPYSAGSSNYTIDTWYPHYKYTYNITLSKAGVKNITAAVLDWETVESTISNSTTPTTLEN